MPTFSMRFNPATLWTLMKMAVPMVISQGTLAVMIFTDRYFLAQIDPTHMAAALGAGVAWFFTISLFNGVLAYANALVAQYLGANEFAKCARVVTQGIGMSIICIPVLVLLSLTMRHLFTLMGHAPEQAALEEVYFSIMMIGSVFTLMKVCMAAFFSGIGRTGVVMKCDLLGVVLNIPLTWTLIFGHFGFPAMGIAGAAISTIFSTVFTLLLFSFYYLSKANSERFAVKSSFVFDVGIIRRYLRLGLPSGLEMFLNVAAFNLFLLMFQSYGITEAASAAIVFNWDMMSYVPLIGLNIAVMSLIGRYLGAGNMIRANQVTAAGYILGLGYSSVLAILFIVFRNEFVELFIFTEDNADSIRELSRFMMIGLSTYVMAESLLQVASGVLRGAGDTRWVMVASVTLHWIMLILQFFIIKVFDFGPRVSWLTFVGMIFSITAVFLFRLRSNVWQDPKRLSRMMME